MDNRSLLHPTSVSEREKRTNRHKDSKSKREGRSNKLQLDVRFLKQLSEVNKQRINIEKLRHTKGNRV